MPIQLKPHQTKIVKYMRNSNARGIILFHGLGSGKTEGIAEPVTAATRGKRVGLGAFGAER